MGRDWEEASGRMLERKMAAGYRGGEVDVDMIDVDDDAVVMIDEMMMMMMDSMYASATYEASVVREEEEQAELWSLDSDRARGEVDSYSYVYNVFIDLWWD